MDCSGCVKSQVSNNIILYDNYSVHCNSTMLYASIIFVGDFHFLWECARVLLLAFWGKVNEPGSFCNLRNRVNRNLVDKQGKTFSVTDEFIFMRLRHTSQLLFAKSWS